MPFITATLQQLFVLLPTMFAAQLLSESSSSVASVAAAAEQTMLSGGIASPLTALVRLCEVFTKAVRPMRYHAVTVLSAALPALAQLQRALGSRQASLQEASTPALFALLDACTKKELQQLHLALAPRPAARTLLKQLHRAFEAEVKYLGKA